MKRIWKLILRIFFTLLILQFVYLIVLKWVNPPITITQIASWVSGNGMQRTSLAAKDVSPNARLAVIASEDQLFPDHNGFDWKSIKKAIEYNNKKPGRIRGASTISQQTAKNVFLWQGKGFIRKGLEVYFTFMIEKIWGKERILEVYLNVAETGKGIFGIEKAAQQYYNKSAKNLTAYEAASIAACLPNPIKYSVKPMDSYVKMRTKKIMQQMNFIQPDKDVQELIYVE